MKKFLTVLLLLVFSSPVHAEEGEIKAGFGKTCFLTKNLNIDQLKDYTGVIFKGKFLGYEYAEEKGLHVRRLKFKVIEPIKGLNKNQKELTLKEWGKLQSPFVDNSIAKNQEYVFFFHKPSNKELTSLTGQDQGVVSIDKRGKVKFSKRLSMKRNNLKTKLFSTQATKDLEINNYQDLKNYLND